MAGNLLGIERRAVRLAKEMLTEALTRYPVYASFTLGYTIIDDPDTEARRKGMANNPVELAKANGLLISTPPQVLQRTNESEAWDQLQEVVVSGLFGPSYIIDVLKIPVAKRLLLNDYRRHILGEDLRLAHEVGRNPA